MTMQPMKAQPIEDMDLWFEGRIPRRLLAIPFSGPIPGPSGKGRDLDGEYFDEQTDIKPDWFDRRPTDWHHSQDPTGRMNGALIGYVDRLGDAKGTLGQPDKDGWWVDLWLNAGERRLGLVKQLAEKGAELYGSSYAYPNLVKRDAKTGHIEVWPYMMQTLSTSPQNTNSVHRPAKAVLDLYEQADIRVDTALKDVLAQLDTIRSFPASLPEAGEQAAKAVARSEAEWAEVLDGIADRAASIRNQLTEDVSST